LSHTQLLSSTSPCCRTPNRCRAHHLAVAHQLLSSTPPCCRIPNCCPPHHPVVAHPTVVEPTTLLSHTEAPPPAAPAQPRPVNYNFASCLSTQVPPVFRYHVKRHRRPSLHVLPPSTSPSLPPPPGPPSPTPSLPFLDLLPRLRPCPSLPVVCVIKPTSSSSCSCLVAPECTPVTASGPTCRLTRLPLVPLAAGPTCRWSHLHFTKSNLYFLEPQMLPVAVGRLRDESLKKH